MTFFQRVEGVFFSPQATLEAVAQKPVWWDVLIVTLISTIIFSVVIMPYATQDALANYQAQGGTAPADLSQMPKWFLIIGGVAGLFSILFFIFLSCGIIYLIGRFFSQEGDFSNILAVYLHAGLVDSLLGNMIRLVLVLMKKTFRVSTSLALLLPSDIPVRSFPYVLLSQFDFFRLWAVLIMAFGLSAVFKVDRKKALLVSLLAWFILTLIFAGLSGLGLALQKKR
jgi:hypothetical protein